MKQFKREVKNIIEVLEEMFKTGNDV